MVRGVGVQGSCSRGIGVQGGVLGVQGLCSGVGEFMCGDSGFMRFRVPRFM
jgi:hypothetical protein